MDEIRLRFYLGIVLVCSLLQSVALECVPACQCTVNAGLTTLSCSQRNLTNFPFGIESSTQFLRLDRNKIEAISGNLSQLLPRLQRIDLSFNRIQELQSRVFNGVGQLNFVNLHDNLVTKIGERIFDAIPSPFLTLILSTNRIQDVHKNAFQGYTGSIELNLGQNNLSYLHPDTFFLSPGIVTLNLEDNKLTTIPANMFINNREMYLLVLSRNRISKMSSESLKGLIGLQTLNLESNLLESLPGNIFKDLHSLLNLNLENNKFVIPPMEHINTLPDGASVTMHGNPIICDCALKNLLARNPGLKSKMSDIDNVICANNQARSVGEELFHMACDSTDVPATQKSNSSLATAISPTTSAVGVVLQTSTKPIQNVRKTTGDRKSWPMIIGVALCVLVLLFVALVFVYLYRRRIGDKIQESTMSLTRRKKRVFATDEEDAGIHYDEYWQSPRTAVLNRNNQDSFLSSSLVGTVPV